MLKKLWVYFIIVLSIISIYAANRKPLFIDYNDTFVLYTQSNSSNCVFEYVTSLEYAFYFSVYGEACQTDRDKFNIDEFLDKFNAQILFSEQTENETIYYARSNSVKYSRVVNGQRVNLQIVIAKEKVFLGSPIVYGSF